MKTPPEIDLFGNPISSPQPVINGKHKTRPNGYAASPGSGPKGERCNTCKHYARLMRSKVYRKCLKVQDHWTHGPGTDIKAKSPACSFWEKGE